MENQAELLWKKCLEIIRDNLNEPSYNTWFAPTKAVQYEENTFVLQVPSAYFVEYIEEKYIDLLRMTMYRVFGKGVNLEYRVLMDKSSEKTTILPSGSVKPAVETAAGKFIGYGSPFVKPKLPDIDPQLNSSYSFNNLIEGKSNKLARTAGISIANDPGKTIFNPLFVYGESGVGKTHLANAIGIMTKQLNPEKRVLYVSANTFQQQYTEAVRANNTNDFMSFYQTIDVLIIDDIQEFASKTGTQNTFFHIFNYLHQTGKQLVLTSDRSPLLLQGLEQRLLTRFKWGLNAEIAKPDFELRKAILKSKIYRDGLEISEDVIDFIADKVIDNVRDLEGTLVSLLAHSTLENIPVDIALAEKVAGRIVDVRKPEITPEYIRNVVCRYFHLSPESISTKSRRREVVLARQIAMYLCKTHTTSSLSAIGSAIGGRDHSTVIYGSNLIADQIKINRETREQVGTITEMMKSGN